MRVSGMPDIAAGLITPAIVEAKAVSLEALMNATGGWAYPWGVHQNFESTLWNWAASWSRYWLNTQEE